MGKGIESWTDVDYAQAAIDILPETVEEIDAWMTTHKIQNTKIHPRAVTCPIAQWIRRWTDTNATAMGRTYATVNGEIIPVPIEITKYVQYSDRLLL